MCGECGKVPCTDHVSCSDCERLYCRDCADEGGYISPMTISGTTSTPFKNSKAKGYLYWAESHKEKLKREESETMDYDDFGGSQYRQA